MKSSLILIMLLFPSIISLGNTKSDTVRLVKWSSESCDNTFNPNRLKNRISNIEHTDSTTIFTIHFSDNCCALFEPAIDYSKNKLLLFPYQSYNGDYCMCTCCFSIRYEIAGLKDTNPQVYFKDSAIMLTDNYYDTMKITYQMYNGEKINQTNKYGFEEGLWIQFYKDGTKKKVSEYPSQSLLNRSSPIWTKKYYNSGILAHYERKDTTESWHENGALKYQFLEYKIGDTTYYKKLSRYKNGQLEEEELVKSFHKIITSELDTAHKEKEVTYEKIYSRQFFENKKPRYLFGTDTSYSWYETGQLKSKSYNNRAIHFDPKGNLKEQSFSWVEKRSNEWSILSHTLYIHYYSNGNIKEIQLLRDEPTQNFFSPGVRYTWSWTKGMTIIESPENWSEPLPWTRFPEIDVKPKMLIGLYR